MIPVNCKDVGHPCNRDKVKVAIKEGTKIVNQNAAAICRNSNVVQSTVANTSIIVTQRITIILKTTWGASEEIAKRSPAANKKTKQEGGQYGKQSQCK